MSLVLRAQRVRVPRIEGGTLRDVRGVVLEERSQVCVGNTREIACLDERGELGIGPTETHLSAVFLQSMAGVTYVR